MQFISFISKFIGHALLGRLTGFTQEGGDTQQIFLDNAQQGRNVVTSKTEVMYQTLLYARCIRGVLIGKLALSRELVLLNLC